MPNSPSQAPLGRKSSWERIKDLAGSITAISAAAAVVLTVVWYLAKPVVDAQYCTVAHAAKVEARIEAHETAQARAERALAEELATMSRRLAAIETHLCILVAGPRPAEQAKCLRLRAGAQP